MMERMGAYGCTQIRPSTAGLRRSPQKDLLAQLVSGWHLGTWVSEGLPSVLIRVTLYAQTICASNTVYAEHRLSSWESGVLACGRQKMTTQPPLMKTTGTDSNELPWLTILHRCCNNSLLGKLSVPYATLLLKDSRKCLPDFLWPLPYEPFSLLILICILSLK